MAARNFLMGWPSNQESGVRLAGITCVFGWGVIVTTGLGIQIADPGKWSLAADDIHKDAVGSKPTGHNLRISKSPRCFVKIMP